MAERRLPLETRKALLEWYDANKRDLPWRKSRDPYAIWVSEVMLQQTQATAARPYFERWMHRYPTIKELAEADPDEALSLWQGLGYYRRCVRLVEGARWVMRNGLPLTRSRWEDVPGVGPYTASAIASIAFDEPVAVVDGNVERVFARLEGRRETGAALLRAAREWGAANLHGERPGDWNQALMELGATICTPRKPRCKQCPIWRECVAFRRKAPERYPARTPSRSPVHLRYVVWAPFHRGHFGIRKVAVGGWWEGMWEFPWAEEVADGADAVCEALRPIVGPGWEERLGSFSHHVTHHRIAIEAWLSRAENRSPALQWVNVEQLRRIAMPSPQRRVAKLALRHLGADEAE